MKSEDNQNMNNLLEENLIIHDSHDEAHLEILIKRKNTDTETMDSKSSETGKDCIIEELRSWA